MCPRQGKVGSEVEAGKCPWWAEPVCGGWGLSMGDREGSVRGGQALSALSRGESGL